MFPKIVISIPTVLSLAIAALGLVGCWKTLRWPVNGAPPRRGDLAQAAAWMQGPRRGGEVGFSRGQLLVQFWRRWEEPLDSERMKSELGGGRNRFYHPHARQFPFGIEYRTASLGRADRAKTPPDAVGWDSGTVTLPCWAPVLLFASCPVAAFFWTIPRRRRARRLKMGLCGDCGYDLTGNVSGLCPECGAAR